MESPLTWKEIFKRPPVLEKGPHIISYEKKVGRNRYVSARLKIGVRGRGLRYESERSPPPLALNPQGSIISPPPPGEMDY